MNKPSSPSFSVKEVQILAREYFGIETSVQPLDSYIDQNFLLTDQSGQKYIFKIANKVENKDVLDLQNQAMTFLAEHESSINFPKVFESLDGLEITTVKDSEGTSYYIRLLSFLDGILLSNIKQPGPELIHQFGYKIGQIDKILQSFSHRAAQRSVEWDLKNITHLYQHIEHIIDPSRRRLVEYFLLQFKMEVMPVLTQLRQSVIHNDANDHNILVGENEDGEKAVSGIIDFGDMVYTHTIFELAIAATYVMFGKEDPLKAASSLIQGYHEAFPIAEKEIEILFYLITTRLCVSVIFSTLHKSMELHNDYIVVSEKSAWKLLGKLIELNPVKALNIFREACGFTTPKPLKGYSRKEILGIRQTHIGKSLSVSYNKPLKIVRGAMQYLFDDKGNTFLDCVNNVCHVGHCHPRVVEAAQKQIAMLNTNSRYLHDYLVQYAQRLTEKLPDPLRVCYIVNSGSEANDLALQLAQTHTHQTDIIVVDGAYHGNLSSLVDISPYKFDGPGGKGSPPNVHKVAMPDPFRDNAKIGDPNSGKKYADQVQKMISNIQKNETDIAAFICESLLSCGGQIVLPENYLKLTYQFIRDAGGVCIADEVQVGFGRMGSFFWGFETQNVIPDIVTLGKPIGNGHPLGAVVTTPEIAESFDNGMEYFNTYGGNPVSCAVGLAVLDVIQEENLQENALEVGAYLKAGLQKLMVKYPLIGDVRGFGLFLGIELVLDRKTLVPAANEAKIIIEKMKDRGILISIDGPLYNVLKIKPPMVFTKENADLLVQSLDEVLQQSF